MPKTFRKFFQMGGEIIYYRKKNKSSVEARYRRHGFNISRSAPNLQILKSRMFQAFREIDKQVAKTQTQTQIPTYPTSFLEFADYYFQNFYKRKVGEKTYYANYNVYKNHIEPCLSKYQLIQITPFICQQMLDNIVKKGYFKTAAVTKSLSNGIFSMAIKHGIITTNPMDIVILNGYEEKHGQALTKDEEQLLMKSTANTPYQTMYAVALYTGLRPNEYKTAYIEGDFIVANNSKRKTKKVEYKKIPISPMLKPYLKGVKSIKFCSTQALRDRLHSLFPHHKLYDLRTTFYTRCQECGVAEVALKKFAGHSLGGLAETYTDLSDEFLLKEAKKLRY